MGAGRRAESAQQLAVHGPSPPRRTFLTLRASPGASVVLLGALMSTAASAPARGAALGVLGRLPAEPAVGSWGASRLAVSAARFEFAWRSGNYMLRNVRASGYLGLRAFALRRAPEALRSGSRW